ncbi:MAG: MFS transporter, partial [Waddliaceae bacterium]|nr:MFS transporter [Waddliaceae bacterium]
MAKSLRSVYTLFIGAVFIFLADGLYGIIIPINMELMGIPSNILGFVASAYYAGLIIGALTCRSIIIRFGHIRSFMMFMVFIALSAVISGAFPQPSVWFFMRFLCGLSQAGALILLDSWINDTVRGEYRGRVISSYMVTIYLSVAISQFMVSLAPPQNFTLFAIIAIFVCCAMVPLALTRSAPPTIKGSETMKV